MTDVYRFVAGHTPLLVSVPHDGRGLAPGMPQRMTEAGKALPDTDWHVAKLYDFVVDAGASLLVANYSRYVVDLNRPAEDSAMYAGQLSTGICPLQTFAGESLYVAGEEPDDNEKAARIETYWRPYHQRIERTLAEHTEQHGYALLWDAHSIPSTVPRLFDGQLPVLNLGSYDGASCHPELTSAVAAVARHSPYDDIVNGRFKGGQITRGYGAPAANRHALQLEIAQRAYMREEEGDGGYDETAAARLRDTLAEMIDAYLTTAARIYD